MKKLLALFLLAFLVRSFFILVWHQTGRGERVSSDSVGYYQLAQSLNEGRGFQLEGRPSARRPPLYPLFIAFLIQESPFPGGVIWAQAFVGALGCLVLFGIGKRLFDEKVALLAALIMSLDYLSIRQTVSVMPETLFVFFLLASFYFLFQPEKNLLSLLTSGGLGGLALLTKEVLLLYFPFLLLWFLLEKASWRLRLAHAGLFFLGLGAMVGPWVLRNSLLFHRPVLITVTAGHTFYLANNPLATGGTTGGEWEGGRDTAYREYDPDEPPLYTVEADRYLFRKGLEFIQNHPTRFFALMGRKIVNMWRPYPTDSPPLAQWTHAMIYLPVLTLGLVGVFWCFPRLRELFPLFALLAYVFLLHAVLIAHIRYRYPVMPFLMLFAAFTIRRLWESMELFRRPFSVKIRSLST